MALEFEQLTGQLDELARTAGARQLVREDRLVEVLQVMRERSDDGQAIERYVSLVRRLVLESNAPSGPYFPGAAYPLHPAKEAVGTAVPCDPAAAPPTATLIGVDGSQIVPDRHAAFVYYLINVGGIAFYHGEERAPEVLSRPLLVYPRPDELDNSRYGSGAGVAVERDMAEIGFLGELTEDYGRTGVPTLALMDQRLLYVPIGEIGPKFKDEAIRTWQDGMSRIRAAGGWLAGLIDRPGKASVISLLRGLSEQFDPEIPGALGGWDGLVDGELFERLLAPGERSAVFVDLSRANHRFARYQRLNEICFFYLNTGSETRPNIARVDIPRSVAVDGAAVAAIHALLVDQCRILGRYPYVLARADEIAVVGRFDQQELEFRIGRMMDRHGLAPTSTTAKQQAKDWVRSSKQRAHS